MKEKVSAENRVREIRRKTVRRQNNSDKRAVLLRDGFAVIPLPS